MQSSAVVNGIQLVIMLFILALIFAVVQPAFDILGAVNHGIGGWASIINDEILDRRGFIIIMLVIALFAGFLLPELQREDATQFFRRR